MIEETTNWLQKIADQLGFDKKINIGICKVFSHTELLYLYNEICSHLNETMPYECMKSIDLIDEWLHKREAQT